MFAPEALVVSLGVDAHGGDREAGANASASGNASGGFSLHGADYLRIGERIAWLGLPTAFVFEGGQAGARVAADNGIHTVNVLEGFETAAHT
jgi:acetoin utilization deacetylase AcuC-like enzyme